MEEFIRGYGIWILLAGIFLAMHWFGVGCGADHRHHTEGGDEPTKPGEAEKRPTRSGGCH